MSMITVRDSQRFASDPALPALPALPFEVASDDVRREGWDADPSMQIECEIVDLNGEDDSDRRQRERSREFEFDERASKSPTGMERCDKPPAPSIAIAALSQP
jgi:hypothetical protein